MLAYFELKVETDREPSWQETPGTWELRRVRAAGASEASLEIWLDFAGSGDLYLIAPDSPRFDAKLVRSPEDINGRFASTRDECGVRAQYVPKTTT